MKKTLVVTGLIGAFSLLAFTGAFAKSDILPKAGIPVKDHITVMSTYFQDKVKDDPKAQEFLNKIEDTKVGKGMLKAMEKQDYSVMQELMNDPSTRTEMQKFMQDPAFQEYHDELHQDPAMQQMHNSMHGNQGTMNRMMGI